MAGKHDLRPAVLTEFRRWNLNPEGLAAAHEVAEAFEALQRTLDEQCGLDGRQAMIVRHKLEEAALWAMRVLESRHRYRV